MRNFATALAIACLGIANGAAAFEGTVEWRTVTGGVAQLSALGVKPEDPGTLLALPIDKLLAVPGLKTAEFQVIVRGARMKELGGNAATANYALVDGESGSIWMINPADKTYVEWTQVERNALDARTKATEKKQDEEVAKLTGAEHDEALKKLQQQRAEMNAVPVLKDLGKGETIAGVATTVFDITQSRRRARGWVASEPADLAKAFQGVYAAREKMRSGAGAQRDPKSAVAEKGVPMRLLVVQENTFRLEEIVAIKPGPVSDEQIGLPSDYKKVTLQELLKKALQARLNKLGPQGVPAGAPPAPAAPAAK